MMPVILSLDAVNLTDEQFYRLCQANRDVALERTATGDLVIMSPVGGKSGNREADLITEVAVWNRQTRLGQVFSSSTVFTLPQGGDRSPDVAWVRGDRWNSLFEANEVQKMGCRGYAPAWEEDPHTPCTLRK